MARETREAKEHRLKTEAAARVAHRHAIKYHTAQLHHELGKISDKDLKKAEKEYSKYAKEFNKLHTNFQNASTTYNPSPHSERLLPNKTSVHLPKSTKTKISSHPPGFKMKQGIIDRQEKLIKPKSRTVSEATRKKMRLAQRKRRLREKVSGLAKNRSKRTR